MSVSINGTNGLVFSDGTSQNTSPFTGGLGFRNRIINGAMMIDQRNAGASVTPAKGQVYELDRWNTQLSAGTTGSIGVQQVSDAPNGFSKSLKITVSTAASSIASSDQYNLAQFIEGYNIADLGFGAVGASNITLSFWVKSSVAGTFSGGITNGAGSRAYVYTYTINSANTWEYKTLTIAGDTSGTWVNDNSNGMRIIWGLGAGSGFQASAGSWGSSYVWATSGSVNIVSTLNATIQFTGVQLEKGSTATSFDYRPYGTELQLCQRYYQTSYRGYAVGTAGAPNSVLWWAQATGNYNNTIVCLPVNMRVSPSVTSYSTLTGASGYLNTGIADIAASSSGSWQSGFHMGCANVNVNYSTNLYFHYTSSAEL